MVGAPLAEGVGRRMLQREHEVRDPAGSPVGDEPLLEPEGVAVLDHPELPRLENPPRGTTTHLRRWWVRPGGFVAQSEDDEVHGLSGPGPRPK